MKSWYASKTSVERHAIYARRYAREKAAGIYADPDRKARQRQIAHDRYWADPEAARERERARRVADAVGTQARFRRWYIKHRDEYLARLKVKRSAQADVLRERRRLAQQTEKVRHQKSQRQSIRQFRERGAPGSHTLTEWQEKCALLGNICVYCGEAKPLTRDHKLPIVRGGTNDIANILPACASCNSRKGTMTAAEFLAPQRRAA